MGLDDKNSGSKVKNLSVPVFLGPLTTTKQEIGSIGLVKKNLDKRKREMHWNFYFFKLLVT